VTIRRYSLIGWAFLFVLAATSPSSTAQIPLEDKYDHWQNPDRWEGITNRYPASGELIEPISAVAISKLPPPPPASHSLFALFMLDEKESVKLTVRLPADNYWMEPVDQSGQRIIAGQVGLNKFSWDDRVVVRFLKRSAADLKGIVLVPGGDKGVKVAPVLLVQSSDSGATADIERYEFGFVPYGDGVQVDVTYDVISPQGQTVTSGRLDHRAIKDPFYIPWNASGQPEGEYHLVVHGDFPVRNKPPVKQTLTLTFHHRHAILLP
jgi:hypothetical protein